MLNDSRVGSAERSKKQPGQTSKQKNRRSYINTIPDSVQSIKFNQTIQGSSYVENFKMGKNRDLKIAVEKNSPTSSSSFDRYFDGKDREISPIGIVEKYSDDVVQLDGNRIDSVLFDLKKLQMNKISNYNRNTLKMRKNSNFKNTFFKNVDQVDFKNCFSIFRTLSMLHMPRLENVSFSPQEVKIELDSEHRERDLLAIDGLRALSYLLACVLLTGYV